MSMTRKHHDAHNVGLHSGMLLLQAGDVQQRQLKALLSDGRQGRHWNKAALGRRESAKQCKEVGQCAQAHLCRRGCTAPRLPGAHRFQQMKPRRLPRGSVSCLTGVLHWRRGQLSLLGQGQARCAAVVANSRLRAHFWTPTGFLHSDSILRTTTNRNPKVVFLSNPRTIFPLPHNSSAAG